MCTARISEFYNVLLENWVIFEFCTIFIELVELLVPIFVMEIEVRMKDILKVKLKVPPIQATKALRAGRGIALPNLRPRHRRGGWGVSATSRPLYPPEGLGTHCTGGWVGPRAGLDGCGKSRPHWDLIPGPGRSLYRLHYPGRQGYIKHNENWICVC